MTTYNSIIEYLKANRERVVEYYNKSSKGISLKEYMNICIWFFDVHPGKARKVLKGTYEDYLGEAIEVATHKANEKEWKAICKRAMEQHVKDMNCQGWYQKNFQ